MIPFTHPQTLSYDLLSNSCMIGCTWCVWVALCKPLSTCSWRLSAAALAWTCTRWLQVTWLCGSCQNPSPWVWKICSAPKGRNQTGKPRHSNAKLVKYWHFCQFWQSLCRMLSWKQIIVSKSVKHFWQWQICWLSSKPFLMGAFPLILWGGRLAKSKTCMKHVGGTCGCTASSIGLSIWHPTCKDLAF